MSTDTLHILDEPRPVAGAAPADAPSPRTEVATAAAAAVDLTKVRLDDVALAQFGDWRGQVKAANTALKGVVHDLSTLAKIAEAKSLRWRLIGQPVADARRVSKALKSELAAVSKTVGQAEADIVRALEAEAVHITPQIEAAEQRLAEEKAERERLAAEAAAKEATRVQAHRDNIAGLRAYVTQAQGATAAQLAQAVEALRALDIGAAWQEFQADAEAARQETVAALVAMQQAAQAKEDHERQVREQAAENARIAAELEARRKALETQAAELTRRQHAESEQRERERAAEQKPDPALSEAAPITQDAQESGSVPADEPATYASNEPEAAGSPSGFEGSAAPAERAADPAPASLDLFERAHRDLEYTALAQVIPPPAPPMAVECSDEDPPHPADAEIRSLLAHIEAARTGSKFPTQPKPSPEWWATLWAKAEGVRSLLQAEA